jgi:hypothetical protein
MRTDNFASKINILSFLPLSGRISTNDNEITIYIVGSV